MSATSTPNRNSRGVPVPGIDTRASNRDASTALQYGGWLTPPQSAHESRRPSLAFSSYSEMPYSADSTATSFSFPPTPIHGSSDRIRQFHYPLSQEHNMTPGLSAPFANGHLTENLVHATLEDHQECSIDQGMAWEVNAVPIQALEDFDIHGSPEQHGTIWPEQHMPEHNFLRQPGSLQPTLFSTSQGMVSEQHIVASNYATPSHHLVGNVPALQYSHPESGYYSSSVLVEPSQISPEDSFAAEPYSSLNSPGHSSHYMSASFDSVANSFDSYDAMDPPSPDGDYYTEQDEAILIKHEGLESPTPNFDSKPVSRQVTYGSQTLPIRGGKKISKRHRKTPVVQHRDNRVGNISLKLEGDNLGFDKNDQVIWHADHRISKPYRCTHMDDDGTPCKGAFDRSEHLKRHMGKHSPERRFPCPLENCKKAIGRSDNACDHFRTHLKTELKNRRNKYHHWDIVKESILTSPSYEERSASKIITNLQRWLENGDAKLQKAHGFGRFRCKL